MKTNDRFTLTEQERQSPLWQKLKAHYERRLHVLRLRNDGPIDQEQTLLIRGRIHEVKTLISINDAMTVPAPRE